MKTSGLPKGIKPYDWALKQLRVPRAHRITRGQPDVVVAVIDLGYRHHPDLDGHLWVNPTPAREDIHGWDFADDDATLEYTGPKADESEYLRGHHVFVAGEVAAVAPKCSIMILRVGYVKGQAGSWSKAVRYAVDHGARIIVEPHGYIQGQAVLGKNLFEAAHVDFGFPFDNPELIEAEDYAWQHGVLIVKGACDNRGRRVAAWECARDPVFAVGSSNRHGKPANICPNTDYVEAGAPGRERGAKNPRDLIWGCGGDGQYISFTGGCMASGFAVGVAALALSRFPQLTAEELRQVLRNTASGRGWNPLLGYGILDAARAVNLTSNQLRVDLRIRPEAKIKTVKNRVYVQVKIENRGVFNSQKALIVLFNGDATKAPLKSCLESNPNPWGLNVVQLGHAISPIRGFSRTTVDIELFNYGQRPPEQIWAQVAALDRPWMSVREDYLTTGAFYVCRKTI